ncbi:hypothetical protein FACS1894137_07330 [Spirochaetia bacterium]|nr:hypothetical protein FACS1894137_07330 [Spirochaetia bacterium]
MIRVQIEDNGVLEQLIDLASSMGMGTAGLPATKMAFDASVDYIEKTWINWAMGDTSRVKQKIKSPSGKLAQSIKHEYNGPLDAYIYTESPEAQRIQDGQPELDMKTTHPYGPHSRMSKDGIPYVIVPIRWGAGEKRAHWNNFIPQPAFNIMEKFKVTRIIRQRSPHKLEDNYNGEPVPRNVYKWGDRSNLAGNMNGMVRMAGGGGYFTFRIISAKQLVTRPYSWIRKAVPGFDMVSAVENATRPAVEAAIQAGIDVDLNTDIGL